MLRAMIITLTLGLAVSWTTPSEAGLIYDNLASETYTPDRAFSVLGADLGGPFGHSEAFVAGATEKLDSILIAVWSADSAQGNFFNLTLLDSNNQVVEFWLGLMAPGADSIPTPVVRVGSMSHALLESGETYQLIVDPTANDTSVGWEFSKNATLESRRGAFRVNGAGDSTVPELSTLNLGGLGAIGLLARVSRRRRT